MLRRISCLPVVLAAILSGQAVARAPEEPLPPIAASSHTDQLLEQAAADLDLVDLSALRRAVLDLTGTFAGRYTKGQEYLKRLDGYEKRVPIIQEALKHRKVAAIGEVQEITAFQRKALLTNPLLDFDRLLLIKRKPHGDPRRAESPDRGLGEFIGMPRQSSWQLPRMPNANDWENEICLLSPVGPEGELSTLYKPPEPRLVTDMDLHFDADKIMFSMPDNDGIWQLFEIQSDGTDLRQVSQTGQPDVHNFDACYLPNGKIAFTSTATFQGVPCNKAIFVGMTYLMDADGSNIRQLCFEQDHNFCPTVMNDGRILYLRWEYTDIPHVWARFLFTMNPDGTNQREYYGSGGYWPNAIFYARPIPGHPTKVVGIVTGHHVGRVGELVILDPALGRRSADGVIQRIPGYGKKVEPVIMDKLTIDSWPLFLHPWPLSEKYFLVAAKPRPQDLWGIYLVDVFDNIMLIKELEDYALLEPVPLRKAKTPPVIVDKVNTRRRDALVYIEDIYKGPGLKGVPRGTAKNLRIFTYHFAYQKIAGINHRVGADGPWEPKRVLGTVPLEEDGSALFRVPANTPISIQPIDAEGKAVQLMRSWMTAMPGEFVSCVGCHDQQNSAPPGRRTIAARRRPAEIRPWYGPVRGFSFRREVQPVLDKYCVTCHDGSPRDDGKTVPDLRGDQGRFIAYKNGVPEAKIIHNVPRDELLKKFGGVFEPSYITLRSYVRVGGLESDLRLLAPGEFYPETSELIQMLQKGHYGVRLDKQTWERLYTWIDLNAPCYGTWREVTGEELTLPDYNRRRELRKQYAYVDEDPEVILERPAEKTEPVTPEPIAQPQFDIPTPSGWPFDKAQAGHRQTAAGAAERTVDLGNGVKLDLVYVPAGRFVMGDPAGHADEHPPTAVTIEKPFWIGKFEVTNQQYACFDPSHDSKYEHKGSWMFNEWDLGWSLNGPRQPVVRISWTEAVEFCRWLSEKAGRQVKLPTEAQWEYACRAGTDSPLYYGDLNADFSSFGNMADVTIRDLVYDVRDQYPPDLVPRDRRFNDGKLVTADVGSYKPNAWRLCDMHGNVWEWTRSAYFAYPYRGDDGRNDITEQGRKVVRGGSWYDRPKRCRSAFRLSYQPWQKVYNVGFRIVVEHEDKGAILAQAVTGH
ncbi:MAG: SUMF1/EgtB/PvdO family nonheme iron enzyme [Planctomycetota bacterium]|jgi:formylglycine-generating enzyme required for sulfatase activity